MHRKKRLFIYGFFISITFLFLLFNCTNQQIHIYSLNQWLNFEMLSFCSLYLHRVFLRVLICESVLGKERGRNGKADACAECAFNALLAASSNFEAHASQRICRNCCSLTSKAEQIFPSFLECPWQKVWLVFRAQSAASCPLQSSLSTLPLPLTLP